MPPTSWMEMTWAGRLTAHGKVWERSTHSPPEAAASLSPGQFSLSHRLPQGVHPKGPRSRENKGPSTHQSSR